MLTEATKREYRRFVESLQEDVRKSIEWHSHTGMKVCGSPPLSSKSARWLEKQLRRLHERIDAAELKEHPND